MNTKYFLLIMSIIAVAATGCGPADQMSAEDRNEEVESTKQASTTTYGWDDFSIDGTNLGFNSQIVMDTAYADGFSICGFRMIRGPMASGDQVAIYPDPTNQGRTGIWVSHGQYTAHGPAMTAICAGYTSFKKGDATLTQAFQTDTASVQAFALANGNLAGPVYNRLHRNLYGGDPLPVLQSLSGFYGDSGHYFGHFVEAPYSIASQLYPTKFVNQLDLGVVTTDNCNSAPWACGQTATAEFYRKPDSLAWTFTVQDLPIINNGTLTHQDYDTRRSPGEQLCFITGVGQNLIDTTNKVEAPVDPTTNSWHLVVDGPYTAGSFSCVPFLQ